MKCVKKDDEFRMNIKDFIRMIAFYKNSKRGELGFEMIIKIVLVIAVIIFFAFLIAGGRESMLSGIRSIFSFGR